MIGIWNYTVILTYMSAGLSVLGATLSFKGKLVKAVGCLALAGLCDAFDGRVARSRKESTEREKLFGMQLDSLCDVISFGIYPAILYYQMGVRNRIGIVLMIMYVIAAIARLAYFNVLELEQKNDEDGVKCYYGLPVTSIAVIFPCVLFVGYWLPPAYMPLLLQLMLLITGGLFVSNLRIRKPTVFQILMMVLLVMALFVTIPFLRIGM